MIKGINKTFLYTLYSDQEVTAVLKFECKELENLVLHTDSCCIIDMMWQNVNIVMHRSITI